MIVRKPLATPAPLASWRARTVASEALRAHCRERLANYKVPKRLELVDSLPMLAIGKVDKVALRARAAADA